MNQHHLSLYRQVFNLRFGTTAYRLAQRQRRWQFLRAQVGVALLHSRRLRRFQEGYYVSVVQDIKLNMSVAWHRVLQDIDINRIVTQHNLAIIEYWRSIGLHVHMTADTAQREEYNTYLHRITVEAANHGM